jgi:predicted transcriptional regulator
MGKYRSRLRIIADILHIASDGAKKTRIMYQANLSYKLLCQYLEEVVSARLVTFEKGKSYVLTNSGERFLERLDEYHKQCKQLEEQTSCVQSERAELEKMLYNVGIGLGNLGSRPKGKSVEKRMV